MTKKKILLLIPLIIISGLLIYCWTTIMLTDRIPSWQHYLALGFFVAVVILFFKSFTKAALALGLYLLLATFNFFSMTADINDTWFIIGGIELPHFQSMGLGLLVLFLILNYDTLVNIYLDYKEAKAQRKA